MSAAPVNNEDTVLPIPNLRLPEAVFVLQNPKSSSLHTAAKASLLKGIEEDGA
jgi:26S proteasome regulatory subunit N7